jgi:glycosyltransferase involved in cell wall biosynthesis
VVTITAGLRQTLSERYGPRERVPVIPSGCDVSDSGEFPGLATDRPPRVVYAGQLYPWKGADVLVEAMALVPEARLVILGGVAGERDLDRVRALVAARGLAGRTEMPGTLAPARVPETLRKAAVVVVPLRATPATEGHTSPIKAFEAMAAGRPIVASDLPAIREFLRHGDNALLVPPGDPPPLAGAVRRLLQDATLAESLARRAFAEAPAYSWDARAGRLAGLFEELA